MLPAGLILLLALLAQAQALTILAPPDRFAAPGEFVTLVFRLEAADPLTVEVSAESASGWRILRQPGAVELTPGRSVPVAVTVEVPSGALALFHERITLQVQAARRYQSSVVLSVTELVNLTLEAPREVTLTAAGVSAVVSNLGNTPDMAELRLLRGVELLVSRSLSLAPGERREEVFSLPGDGLFTLELASERGIEVRRSVSVIRFGIPPPEPFLLAAEATGGLSTAGTWQTAFSVEGALSDYTTLDAQFKVPEWQRSFAEATLDRLSLRLGSGWRDPFRLGLPADFGVSGSLQEDGWGIAAALGGPAGGRFTGVVAGSFTPPGYSLAAALGLREGQPLARLRAELLGRSRLTAELDYRQGVLEVALSGEADGLPGNLQAGLKAQGLGQGTPRLIARADYRGGGAAFYGDASLSLGSEARLGGRIGLSLPISPALRLSAQLGAESFARLGYQAELAGGWQTWNTLGLRHDPVGLGFELDSSWTRSAEDHLNLDLRLVYYPGVAELDGRIGLRYQRTFAPLTVALSSGWSIAEQALGASAALTWRQGSWRAGLSTSLAYGYAPHLIDRWSFGAAISAGYAFTIEVPPAVVAATGGRHLGLLAGLVQVGDAPLPGVVVSVGRYRLQSDEAGRFRAELPPGRYRLAVELATLPIAYRLLENGFEVEIAAHEVTTVALTAVATTALRGQVLEDAQADGTPDEPARGVAARLLLTDAEGLRRLVVTDQAGSFLVRGLLPGPVEVRLIEVPLGATVVGSDYQTASLLPGLPTDITFLVQPAAARARAFVPGALRLRGIELGAQRVPPGAAPLLLVRVQGEAELVQVVTPDATHDLAPAEGLWLGRVAVPADAPPGVYEFTVIARAGDAEASRRGQLIIDAAAPALELTSNAPVRPNETLQVTVVAHVAAEMVSFSQPFGADLALTEEEPGRWVGSLAIPANAEDAVHSLRVRVTAAGRIYEEELRFRVLAP